MVSKVSPLLLPTGTSTLQGALQIADSAALLARTAGRAIDASQNGRVLLTSGSVTAAANLTLASGFFSSTFASIVLELTGLIGSVTNSQLQTTVSTDGGSTWLGTGTYKSDIYSTASDAAASSAHNVDNGSVPYAPLGPNNAYGLPTTGGTNMRLTFPKPWDTTSYKTFENLMFGYSTSGTSVVTNRATITLVTMAAINALRLTPASGNLTTLYAMYGII